MANGTEQKHTALFGRSPEAVLSAPGRTELSSSHTDHQTGRVIAAAIRRSITAAVSPRINFYCFYYNKFDFGCKCLSGNFKKTVSRSSYVLSAAAKAREAYAFFQN